LKKTTTDRGGLRICLLGAPGTGKTRLAADLRAALQPPDGSALPFTIDDLDDVSAFTPPAAPDSRGLVLLMGLDLPAAAGGEAARDTADRALRTALAQAGVAYQVVYGQGAERTRQALQAWLPAQCAAGAVIDAEAAKAPAGQRKTAWAWTCGNCSDPHCERRLLSDLLATRTAARLGPDY
jgi:DNA replicative helicase MCM subunit Mcm2 (Cdc46/Mcm family)